MPQLQDFQFFQMDRLNEIYEKEQAYELHKHALHNKEAAARAQVSFVILGHADYWFKLCHTWPC